MKRVGRTRTEKDFLSKLSNMINYSEYIHANLVDVARTCGNKNCRCMTKGQKHISLYLTTIRKDGVRKMIYIPKNLEECHSSPAMNHAVRSIEPVTGNYI